MMLWKTAHKCNILGPGPASETLVVGSGARKPLVVSMGETMAGTQSTLGWPLGRGWVPRGRHAPSALPLHVSACRVDGVQGRAEVSPVMAGVGRSRNAPP
jgi:hypothetical protein